MSNVTNIPTGLGVPTQIPLDTIAFNQSESLLSNLGTDNFLAYKYYEGLLVHCINDKTTYIWREVQSGEENTGLVNVDFTYPNNHIVYEIDYSNRVFNFFIVENLTGDNFSNYIQLQNIGTGEEVFKAFNSVNSKYEFKTLKSNTLSIVATSDEISINTPESAMIPALYVNNLYQPTYEDWVNAGGDLVTNPTFLYRGEGTLAKPFTDSRNYTSTVAFTDTPNTAIQNALDGHPTLSYVGTGTRLLPQRSGQQIIVQSNNSSYTHIGDYNYENINILFNEHVTNTTSGYLIDMDNPLYFNATNGRFLITIVDGKLFQSIDSLGFRNSGNTSSIPPSFDTGRTGAFQGDGTIYFSYSGANILTRYIFNGDGNNNDDSLHFQVKCKVKADQQGIYYSKNRMRMDFYNLLESGVLGGTGNIALKAFHMTGGQIRFYEKGSATCQNGVTGRTYGFTFEPQDDGIGYTIFQLNSGQVSGNAQWYFAKLNNEAVSFLAYNSPSGNGFSTTNPGSPTVVDGLFENLGVDEWIINFKNNIFSYTGIDQTKVDLTGGNTYSAVNFIGNEVLENLVVFDSKVDAVGAGHPLNSAFIKRTVFNAVDLLAGVEYKVVTPGSPSLGTPGDFFIATGSETGIGTASLETREIIT